MRSFGALLVEFRPVRELAAADVILGVFQQVPEFGAAVRRHDQIEAGGQQVASDFQGFIGMGGGGQDAGHSSVSSCAGFVASG